MSTPTRTPRYEELSERIERARWQQDPFVAHDIASEGLAEFPGDAGFRQKQALALIQTGSLDRAVTILQRLAAEGNADSETLGLLGSAWKARANAALSQTAREAALGEALKSYRLGLENAEAAGDPAGSYPGINAASLLVELGDLTGARDLARRTTALAGRAPKRDYWTVATLAEAALIEGEAEEARMLLREARALHPAPGQAASTRRQVRRLARYLTGDAAQWDHCFHVPPVLLFVGHATDLPGRPVPRFSEAMVPDFAAALAARLGQIGGRIGYASAARGGDLLFLEAMQAAGAETHIVLALERDAFCRASVSTPAHAGWDETFDRVLTGATSLRVANENSSQADGLTFEFCTRLLLGLAWQRARQLDTELHTLVLWNGAAGDGHGGTSWAIGHLLGLGARIENLFPGLEGPVIELDAPAPPAMGADERAIRAVLFADCKGYSKLREERIADYTRHFLTGVKTLTGRLPFRPIAANTWGDGLFLVFENVQHAAEFALMLQDAALRPATPPEMPAGVCLRIALHAGPISPLLDPVTGRRNFVGINVGLAARIEPITAENQIFVSEAFAALASGAGVSGLHFEYLGKTRLAKDYGSFPIYQLLRR